MSGFLKWLRGLGSIGGHIANFLQIGGFLGFSVSALIALWIGFSSAALLWVQRPAVYVSAGAFLFCLWTYIGFSVLRNRNRTQPVKIIHDYSYALIPEGWGVSLAKFDATHATDPNADAVIVICSMRNNSSNALKVRVEEFRIVLDGRTCDHMPFEMVFPRIAPKGIQSGGIRRDPSRPHLMGTAFVKLLYGPVDGDFVRLYTLRQKIQIAFDSMQKMPGINNELIEEKDESYVSG